uniref:G-protein coupled receptors family 1 profile domain-containing protein n=1 Tax=Biomphalaria glabrata TaxID=6526 RepID=A0A2C9L1J8_BIOGL
MSATNKYVSENVMDMIVNLDPLLFNGITVCVSVCTLCVCLIGVAANVINIQLFRRQGYQDGVNVTLTALAVSDLGALIMELAYAVNFNPLIKETDRKVSRLAIAVISGYSHEYFIRVSSAITTFAAFKRCLCVTRPLKVKAMISTRMAVYVNACVFLGYSLYFFLNFYTKYLDWAYVPELNMTVVSVFLRSSYFSFFPVTLYFTDLLLPYATFTILISCSVLLFHALQSKSKWRQSISIAGDKLSNLTYKERKSAKLFMSVSIMCVSLLLPEYLLFDSMIFIKGLSLGGKYSDVREVVSSCIDLLKTLNSSLTIVIYYKMSTKFRLEFNNIMGRRAQAH